MSLRAGLVSSLAMVLATMAAFLAALAINMVFFAGFEFSPGIGWIFLPAGVRVLVLLLFAEAGAVGLLLVSWAVGFFLFFPEDPVRAFAGGVVATVAPYGVYLWLRRRWALRVSLSNLTPARLLVLAVACSIGSPLLHHAWFMLYGDAYSIHGLIAMFSGDLIGSLAVLYAAKALLVLVQLRQLR